MNNSTQPIDGAPEVEAPTFNAGEVAFLLGMVNDSSNRVYALLSGIRSMLPQDKSGEPDDPSLATLVQMALDEVADIAYQRGFVDRLPEELRP
jgi:hypothetical protein